MPRGPSPVKPQQWTERLYRFEESHQTVAEFCQAEGVSEASFYQWRRRLGHVPRTETPPVPRRSQATARPRPSFQSVIVRDTSTQVTIRLPQGSVMELGSDPQIIQMVVRELLTHQATRGPAAC
jgi:transposase-like protein